MIVITCPNNNVPERTYVIEVLFGEVLGCKHGDYSIQFANVENYEIAVEDRVITVEDHFFNHHVEPLSYLSPQNIPQELRYFHALNMELPIIYGVDKYCQDEKSITIGLDVFASAFFMLTRWEEDFLGRQVKGDCDETLLFCVKHDIYQRPIVNEYAEFLSKVLFPHVAFLNRDYEVILTHDVDGFIPPTWPQIIWNMAKQTAYRIIRRRSLSFTWREQVDYKKHYSDPYIQFEMYTSLARKYRVAEWFYIKVCGKGETEATYLYNDERTVGVINKLKANDNLKIVLGFHPSQNTFGKNIEWNKEVSRITTLLHKKPTIGRNHHLLFNHETLLHWEGIMEQPMSISNCVFHKRLGFRSGACIPYHLFDLYQRRQMNLIENPCQIMDTAIRLHNYENENHLWNDMKSIIGYVKKYSGCLLLTWHIYVRKRNMVIEYYDLCDKVLENAVGEIK